MDPAVLVKRSLLLCISGSVAAATTSALTLQIIVERKVFEGIYVALSECALRFVREEPFAVLSRRPCIKDIYAYALEGRAIHVEVAAACDFALVVPATGNLIAKLAHGIADDTITNMLSVFEGRKILVPAVHPATSRKASFIRNLNQLKNDGFIFCGPVPGYSISEGRRGADVAAMPPPDVIAAFLEHVVIDGEPPSQITFEYPAHNDLRG